MGMKNFKYVILYIAIGMFSLHSLFGDYNKKEIEKLEKDIIGIWANPKESNAPLLFITNRYVLVFTEQDRKDYEKNIRYFDGPYKSSYSITEEDNGKNYFRSSFWYKIIREGESLNLNSNSYYLGICLRKGTILKKISKEEAFKLLEEYNVDFNALRKKPITPRQEILRAKNPIKEQPKNDRGFLTSIEDNSLPEEIEEFLKLKSQNK